MFQVFDVRSFPTFGKHLDFQNVAVCRIICFNNVRQNVLVFLMCFCDKSATVPPGTSGVSLISKAFAVASPGIFGLF